MLDKLEALVFGFGDYEKAKIDERFNQIPFIINNLDIKEIKDFEILENVIFKIKELLRVKSSNLNSIIRNPKKKLSKKKVLEIVDILDSLKYDFLKKAFSAIKKEEKVLESETQEKINYEESVLTNVEIISNNDFRITIENGKVPYILIDFKKEVDFILIKNLSILFFENFKPQGTNVLIQENKVLIIPRFEQDNLFSLPQIEVNIDEVYLLLNKSNSKVKDADFIELGDNNIKREETKEKQDDSLDSLLSDMRSKNFKPRPNPQKDISNVEIEKSDPVEVSIDKTKGVEVLKKENYKAEEKEVQVENKEIKKKEVKESQEENKKISNKTFEIFRDDKIVVYLREDSKVLGELVIENIFGKKLKEIEDSVLTYMLMFAKVFGSVLFEIKEAHGTNILYDFNDSKIKILPRTQDDQIKLNWNLSQATEDELNDIKDKLLKAMSFAMNSNESLKENNESAVQDKSSVVKKAEHILYSLKRIP